MSGGKADDVMRIGARRSLLLVLLVLALIHPAWAAKPELRCRPDGTFTVVMFSDLHHGKMIDPRTATAMGKVLEQEKPDFVVVGGDCLAGGLCDTVQDVKNAIRAVGEPMEQRTIPWAIVFGNHDQEHFPKTKLGKEEVIGIYASYPCNLNVRGSPEIHGAGNDDLLVKNSAGTRPVFCLWLLDSGAYADAPIGGYDWIHTDQVAWYYQTSKDLEARYKRKIPGLMFFHIPLREFAEMSSSTKFAGERNEPECPSRINSGLFAAVLERGDVQGIFCGHDHTNDYVGEWFGVRLGYDYSAGYAAYGLRETDPRSARGRGGRVFRIKESDPWAFTTWMRFEDGSTDQRSPAPK
jgi:3',5'-cyclic AMP phosphodiesterase CpdA